MIRARPQDATTSNVLESLHVRRKIELGLQQLVAGQGVPHDEAMKWLSLWVS